MAARYWRKMTGALVMMETGCLTTMENIRDPGGETQTFDPRPRPATWMAATAVRPLGSLESSFGFLTNMSACSE